MAEEPTFRELIRRVRAGEEQASAKLVRRYEPAIRVRLRGPHLRRLLDSMDAGQSVLLNFFVRAAAGQCRCPARDRSPSGSPSSRPARATPPSARGRTPLAAWSAGGWPTGRGARGDRPNDIFSRAACPLSRRFGEYSW
jgi:hypothetical protein